MTAKSHCKQSPLTRRCITAAVGGLLVAGCGGNPASPVGQGAANLPPQTNPAVTDGTKKVLDVGNLTLQGSVTDAATGEPLSKATLFIEGVTTTSTSTPIPATPAPKDENTGGGGGPAPAATDTQSPTPGALGAPPLGGATPGPASPTPTGLAPALSGTPAAPQSPPVGQTPLPAASASGAIAANPAAPYPLQTLQADSRGKFELKGLLPGTYSMTVWAPGYEAQTFQGSLPDQLNVPLRPLAIPSKYLHSLKGVVSLADNKPASHVEVESSSTGQLPSSDTTTDAKGDFQLKGLLAGNYAVAAWDVGADGDISAFAMLNEVPLALGREKRTVSPTLILHALSDPWLLAGTVEGTKLDPKKPLDAAAKANVVKPVSVRTFIRVGTSEIPLATTPIGQDGYFRVRLPQLQEGASYHLVAAGITPSGQTVYLHQYDITQSNPKMAIQLPDPPSSATVTRAGTAPAFAWEAPAKGASAYRLSLEGLGEQADTLWQGWTTGTSIQLPDAPELKLLKAGESYRYILSAIQLGDKDTTTDLTAIAALPWSASALSAPSNFEAKRPKPGDNKVINASPSPKPDNKRYKTMEGL